MTEAGKQLLRELRAGKPSENWLSIASWVQVALVDIEAEAIAARDAEIRAGVEGLHGKPSDERWLSRSAVLALLRQAEPPETHK